MQDKITVACGKNEKEDVSRIMPLTDENKEKNAENLKKARKNDEKTEPW